MQKLVFGTDIKQQVAALLNAHIEHEKHFKNNHAAAAKHLGISRQRLFSYTSAATLPRPRMFDLIFQKWGLNLLGKPSRRDAVSLVAVPTQRLLFDKPITLRSNGMKVVIKRDGTRVVASIEISADVKIA